MQESVFVKWKENEGADWRVVWGGGTVNNWHEMNCRQSHCFVEHKTIRRRWFIVAGRTRALLCVHIVCVLMELWCLSRSISKMRSHVNAPKSGWSLETETFPAFFPSLPHAESIPFFAAINSLSVITISSCMSLPDSQSVYVSLLPIALLLCQDAWQPLAFFFLPSSHISLSPHSFTKPLPSLKSNQERSLFLFPDAGGGRTMQQCRCGGLFVVKLTCAVFTKRMSWAGLCPGSTVCMTLSFVMHWPVHLLLPKCCPGSRPNSLLILSALRLRGKTQAQNGCHCHCTVLSVRVCMHCFRKNKIMQVLECRI